MGRMHGHVGKKFEEREANDDRVRYTDQTKGIVLFCTSSDYIRNDSGACTVGIVPWRQMPPSNWRKLFFTLSSSPFPPSRPCRWAWDGNPEMMYGLRSR